LQREKQTAAQGDWLPSESFSSWSFSGLQSRQATQRMRGLENVTGSGILKEPSCSWTTEE
jgi:hypothetical protein